MARNDEGEFELVLGNRQLLSVFFIVVVLLGVFFTMGYIVGRNSSAETAARLAQTPGQPLVVESELAQAEPAAAEPAAEPPAQPARPPVEPPPETTAASKPSPSPPPPVRPAPAQETRTAPPARAGTVGEPPPGNTFLQVAATSRPEAEVLAEVLGKRGFQSQIAPVPNQDLVRVLVGPCNTSEELSQTRAKLQDAGFKPFTRRY